MNTGWTETGSGGEERTAWPQPLPVMPAPGSRGLHASLHYNPFEVGVKKLHVHKSLSDHNPDHTSGHFTLIPSRLNESPLAIYLISDPLPRCSTSSTHTRRILGLSACRMKRTTPYLSTRNPGYDPQAPKLALRLPRSRVLYKTP